jgi:hypothetical protein
MKDPNRLLCDSSDPLRTALMRSALHDAANEGSKARIATAIGIGAAGSALTTTTTAARPVAASGASIAKWIRIGMATVTAGALGTILVLSRHQTAARAPVPPSTTATAEVVPTVAQPGPAPATADPPTVDVSSLPRARSARWTATLPTASARAAGGDAPSLSAELAALDDARASLSAGKARDTLAKLDAYDREFPAGHLRDEATVLRVEALIRSGDGPAAQALGQRFLAASPSSAYGARVRSLLAAQGTESPSNGP